MNTETSKNIAQTIIDQIKATDFWFLARVGYNSPSFLNNTLHFKVNGSKVGYAYVSITLNSMDTYDIQVFKIRRAKFDIKKTILGTSEGIYSDGLVQALNYLVEGK